MHTQIERWRFFMPANFVTRLSLCLVALSCITALPTTLPTALPTTLSAGQTAIAATDTMQMAPQKQKNLLEDLKLTNTQKQKIQALRTSRTRAINNVLTPAQRTKFEKARKSGMKTGQSLKSLGLSADQNKKILDILKKSQQELRNTLTPTQRQKLDAAMKRQGNGTAVE